MSDFVTGASPAIPVANLPPLPPPSQAGTGKPSGVLHASTRFSLNRPLASDYFTRIANATGLEKQAETKKADPPKTEPPKPDPQKPGEKADEKGKTNHTSRMVGRFKVGYAIVGSGILNAFLFGTPLWVSGGLATAFAALQAAIATKIERGDTPAAKKMLQGAKKIVGAKDTPEGNTRQGRVMAMVWGGVAGALSLAEACMNDAYRAFRGITTEEKPAQVIKRLQEQIQQKAHQGSLSGFLTEYLAKPFYRLQLQGVQFCTGLEKGAGLPGWQKPLSAIWNFTRQRARGNRWLGYAAAIGAGFIGACIQTGMADLLQKRLTRNKPKPNPSGNEQK